MSTSSPHETNRLLARTVNIGADFGAALEQGWTVPVGPRHLDLCHEAGFSAVRLATCWAAHTTESRGRFTVDPTILDSVDLLLDQAAERGLSVVLNNLQDPELMADPLRHLDRLLASTHQVAERFSGRPAQVVLEPLAEPHGPLDPLWNDYLRQVLTALREADPARAVVIGPASYNNMRRLPDLRLPEDDRNLIVTVHQYWPITFTMQGETWLGTETPFGDPVSWLGTTWQGSHEERSVLSDAFAGLAEWARAHDRPILVGEFGTSGNADPGSRARWAAVNRRLAEEHGFSWGYWSFGPTFALYDESTGGWDPALLQALGLGQAGDVTAI
ncbi:glycoside hydrolase family 5 protein [Nonomuraea sp. 3-1Str]|uniref:glycoside hydrolase family 5 protein n=1 Tax=Nonomuraea sp. 3-1Str TaxID=2929801 RepID=UPI00286281D2|nr:cellulase family glycosylhydrolase [Nonomuraea sp. 3-1Str]MDR8411692.1 glycoside hydrolase family 5 protein [Nonomuraea sp. 3-1Str]